MKPRLHFWELNEEHLCWCLIVLGQPIRLSPETEITIYRIVQESLNNVIAHAQAETVQIRITFSLISLQITIHDNGIGFDDKDALATVSDQMGLIGMKERTHSIGGQIEVRSSPGQGTQVTLNIPLLSQFEPESLVS